MDDLTLNTDDSIECNTSMMNDSYDEETNNINRKEPTPDQEIIIELNNEKLIDVEEQEKIVSQMKVQLPIAITTVIKIMN